MKDKEPFYIKGQTATDTRTGVSVSAPSMMGKTLKDMRYVLSTDRPDRVRQINWTIDYEEGGGCSGMLCEVPGSTETKNRMMSVEEVAQLIPQELKNKMKHRSDEAFKDVIELAIRYFNSNKNHKNRKYGENWLRVLKAFDTKPSGVETWKGNTKWEDLKPFSAAEAAESGKVWHGWKPFRVALKQLEADKEDTVINNVPERSKAFSMLETDAHNAIDSGDWQGVIDIAKTVLEETSKK